MPIKGLFNVYNSYDIMDDIPRDGVPRYSDCHMIGLRGMCATNESARDLAGLGLKPDHAVPGFLLSQPSLRTASPP